MRDIVDRCRNFGCSANDICNSTFNEAADEIERLRDLLRHADNVVIWEHTPARSGFQEEIEDALGIGKGTLD